jgi:alpha-amylase
LKLLPLILVACGAKTAAPAATKEPATPVIYFAMTDRFANGDRSNDHGADPAAAGAYHGGDLAGLRAKLPYLDELGVDVLWISPIVDNIDEPVRGAGFEDWGYHGYWAKDFERVDEHLGTEDDLRGLVAHAHARGMRVLLDVVLNHPGYGARWADDPAWTRAPTRGDCGADALTECLYGLPDFRTERPEVADWLIARHVDWLARSGADGFRVDSAKHVGLDVLAGLRAAAPRAFLLGEVWGLRPGAPDAAPYLAGAFDAVYDFELYERAFAFVTGAADARVTAAWLAARGPDADRFVTFLNTHDTPGFLHRLGGDRDAFLVAAALLLTAPGTPLLYYGDELGRRGGDWPHNRSDMPWDAPDVHIQAGVRELVRAHRRVAGPIEIVRAEERVLVYRRGGVTVTLDAAAKTWKIN